MHVAPIGIRRDFFTSPIEIDAIKKIALSCFKELAISFGFGALLACFMPPTGIAILAQSIIIQTAVGFFFQSLRYYAEKAEAKKWVAVFDWCLSLNFALCTGVNCQALIHESGHAAAATLVYKKPGVSIALMPFSWGCTKYRNGLNPLGEKMGALAASFFVIASGPSLALLVSSALLTTGLAIKKNLPQFGKYLITWALVDFAGHARYACSGMRGTQPMHDFVRLSRLGLHPIVAIVGMIAVPILIIGIINKNKFNNLV